MREHKFRVLLGFANYFPRDEETRMQFQLPLNLEVIVRITNEFIALENSFLATLKRTPEEFQLCSAHLVFKITISELNAANAN